MSPIKQVERSATLAFSPTAPYMAVGTMAGAIDISFSSSACLEVFKLDYSSPSTEMPLAGGAVATSERFHRLVWGTTGLETEAHPYGIIAGGLVDGTVNLWNPAKIIGTPVGEEAGENSGALISKLQKHTGAVKGLQFNSFSSNLLASGGADGELNIWDLANPSAPSLYPALKSGGGAPAAGEITHLAWNNKVQHILASCSADGTTVVWDLKRQRHIWSFKDPNTARRCSAIQWNPEVATQLIVASDDDRSPTLQIWDLRMGSNLQREFSAHTKGVLSMAWCEQDTSLLLSSAKDNRTLCWDTKSGQPVAELPSSSNWNFDVQWNPRTPGVVGAASFDGQVHLYSLDSASAPASAGESINADFSESAATIPKAPMLYTPTWLKRPCGVMMGFGGKTVSFDKEGGVKINKVVTDQSLVSRSAEFETAVSSGDKEALKAFCASKAEAAAAEDAEVWAVMKVLFEEDSRRKLLDHLGFEPAAPEEEPLPEEPPASPAPAPAPAPVAPPAPEGDGSDFFDDLPEAAPPAPPPAAPAVEQVVAKVEELSVSAPVAAAAPTAAEEQSEAALQAALVVGDYKTAVNVCLGSGRMADALMVASIAGEELWAKAQAAYMAAAPRPYMKVIKALVSKDLQALVHSRPVALWRETLAILCTYAPGTQWKELVEVLADKLCGAAMTAEGTVCYVCAGSVDKAASIWAAAYASSTRSVDTLQAMMEKAMVLCKATTGSSASPALAQLINEYAELLVSQGEMHTAMNYLCMLPGEDAELTAALRDRIYNSRPADGSMQKTAAPWSPQSVKPDASAAAAPAAAAPQQPAAPAQNTYQPAAQTNMYQPAPQNHQQSYAQQQSFPGAGGFAPQAAAAPAFPGQQAAAAAGAAAYPAQQQRAAYAPQPAPQQQPPSASYAAQPMQPSPAYAAPAPQQRPPQQQPHPQAAMFTPQAFQPQPQPTTAPVQPAPVAAPQQQVNTAYMPPPASYQSQAAPQQPQPPQQQPQRFTPQAAQFQAAPMQPAAPAQQPAPAAAPAKPAPPPGPPANISVETADVSAVKEDLRPIVTTLTVLFQACAAASQLGAKKRESDDNSKRIGGLFYKLNQGDISQPVSAKLLQLAAALDAGDYASATHLQVALTTSDWDECSQWLTALKRLIKTRQTLG